jgi:hypothetical protein
MNSIEKITNFDLRSATPADYLAGLRAITKLADDYEALARQYSAETVMAIEAHIKCQLDAAKELTAVVLAQATKVA